MGIGMEQGICIFDQAHMPFPKEQITTLHRGIRGQGLPQLCQLLVTVARHRYTAAAKGHAHEAGTIDAPTGITPPQIGCAQIDQGSVDRIAHIRRKMGLWDPSMGCLCKPAFICAHMDQCPMGQGQLLR